MRRADGLWTVAFRYKCLRMRCSDQGRRDVSFRYAIHWELRTRPRNNTMSKLLIALAVGLTAIASAQAQTTTNGLGPDWASRTYLGVAVAGAENRAADDDWKAGGKVFAGYNVDQNWALEAGYTRFGNEDVNVFSTSGFGQGEVKSSSSYVAAKYAVPLNERLSAYGKLGVARNERKVNLASNGASYSDNDNGVYGAVGLQYALGQNLSLVGEYERYGKQPEIGAKADVVSVGLKVGF